jgi:hypothetical protein
LFTGCNADLKTISKSMCRDVILTVSCEFQFSAAHHLASVASTNESVSDSFQLVLDAVYKLTKSDSGSLVVSKSQRKMKQTTLKGLGLLQRQSVLSN